MTIALTLIGAILGMIDAEFRGFLLGGTLGFLLGSVFRIGQQLAALRNDVDLLIASRRTGNIETVDPVSLAPSAPATPAAARVETDHTANIQPEAVTISFTPQAEATPPQVAPTEPVRPAATRIKPAQMNVEPVPDPLIITWLKNYFSGEHLVARIGVIVLFFGVGFLLKYAAEHTHVPIELRLAGIAAGGIALLVTGWRLRNKYADYALVLQGGAIGVLYLTAFAAMRLYQVMPPALTLLVMVGIVAFSAMLAVLQNSRALAILGICGGFLAPILTSTEQGSHVVLFSYYALLNAGIFGMAWFKAWRPLNVLGFAFTFVIGTLWGVTRYQSENFASTEPFLILFFLFYVAIAVLYALKQAPVLKSYVDGTLVFGTPIIAFGLQAGMTQQRDMLDVFEYGLSISAIALSLFYLTLARVLYARKQDTLRVLVESFIALGVVFATLAIPLALDARWTSASWALEGAAVVWLGVRQDRWLARSFGTLLQFAAGIALLNDHRGYGDAIPILNSVYLGGALLSVAGLFSAWLLDRHAEKLKSFEHALANILFAWGTLWWISTGAHEIEHFVHNDLTFSITLTFFALSAFVFSALNRLQAWRVARVPALALLPVMWVMAVMQWALFGHPFTGAGYIGWGLAFACMYLILYLHEDEECVVPWHWFHAATLWLLALLATHEAAWMINHVVQGRGTWPLIAWAWMPGLLVAFITLRGENFGWPTGKHYNVYLGHGALPLVIFMWLWSLHASFNSDGNPYPLSYLPLLNPLDLAEIFAFIVLGFWLLKIRDTALPLFAQLPHRLFPIAVAAALFVWLNAALLRTLHYWADVPLNFYSMQHSILVQASLSIFWSVLAMGLMKYASAKGQRLIWMTGGVLMGVVVLKLFTVDIESAGSLERIFSFIGVAVLMLIIGYIAPLPARQTEGETNE